MATGPQQSVKGTTSTASHSKGSCCGGGASSSLPCFPSASTFYNHAALVDGVYPSGPGEEGPRLSSLSLLLYYARNKPSKLSKIGPYLVGRLGKDLSRHRYGYVKITLIILNALLDECSDNAHLMASSTLRIIDSVLSSPDLDMVMMATGTFILFSRTHEHDRHQSEEVDNLFAGLVAKFCNMSGYTTALLNDESKTQLAGFNGIHAIVSNPSFSANSRKGEYVQLIIPALLAKLRFPLRPESTLSRESTVTRKKTVSVLVAGQTSLVIDNLLHSSPEIENICKSCLQHLFSKAALGMVEMLLEAIIKCIPEDSKAFISLVDIIKNSISAQYRYLLMKYLLLRLPVDQQPLVCVAGIQHLLHDSSNNPHTGISVVELLDVVFSQATKFPGAFYPYVEVIGALIANVSYPDQFADILVYLGSKVEDPITFFCLYALSKTRRSHIYDSLPSRCPFPVDLLRPFLNRLTRPSLAQQSTCRITFYQSIWILFHVEIGRPQFIFSSISQAMEIFVQELFIAYHSFFQSSLDSIATPVISSTAPLNGIRSGDSNPGTNATAPSTSLPFPSLLRMIFELLKQSIGLVGPKSLIIAIPFIYNLHDLCTSKLKEMTSKPPTLIFLSHMLETLVLEYLQGICVLFNLTSFLNTLKGVKSAAVLAKIYVAGLEDDAFMAKRIEDLISLPSVPEIAEMEENGVNTASDATIQANGFIRPAFGFMSFLVSKDEALQAIWPHLTPLLDSKDLDHLSQDYASILIDFASSTSNSFVKPRLVDRHHHRGKSVGAPSIKGSHHFNPGSGGSGSGVGPRLPVSGSVSSIARRVRSNHTYSTDNSVDPTGNGGGNTIQLDELKDTLVISPTRSAKPDPSTGGRGGTPPITTDFFSTSSTSSIQRKLMGSVSRSREDVINLLHSVNQLFSRKEGGGGGVGGQRRRSTSGLRFSQTASWNGSNDSTTVVNRDQQPAPAPEMSADSALADGVGAVDGVVTLQTESELVDPINESPSHGASKTVMNKKSGGGVVRGSMEMLHAMKKSFTK